MKTHAVPVAVITIAVFLIMAPTFSWVLTNDDYYHVDRAAQQIDRGVLSAFTETQADDESIEYEWSRFGWASDYYRPIADLSFVADYALYDLWQSGYRLTNAVIYLLSALCVYALALLLGGARPAALIGALLFATNYGHENTIVSFIAGRTDSLVGMFFLMTVAAFIAYRKYEKRWLAPLVVVLVALTLFSKELGVGLFLVLIAYDLLYPKQSARRWLPFHMIPLILTAAYLYTRLLLFGDVGALELQFPTSLGRLFDIAQMPIDNLIPPLTMIHAGGRREAAILAAYVVGVLILYVPILLRERMEWKLAMFSLLGFFGAAGLTVLLPGPPTGRWLYAATGFLTLWVGHALWTGATRGASWIPSRLRFLAAAGLVLFPALTGLWTFAVAIDGGKQASAITSSLIHDMEVELVEARPGDRVFVILPATCQGRSVFYNGFQDWLRLRYDRALTPYVLALLNIADCQNPPRVEALVDSANSVLLRVEDPNSSDEITLSQTRLALMEVGESLTNRYSSVTLVEAGPYRRFGRLAPKAIEISINAEALQHPGMNHFLFAPGRALYRLSNGEWRPAGNSTGDR